jgi:hypothetical protein
MGKLGVNLVSFREPRHAVTLATLIPFIFVAVPARAQDFFGLFRLFSPPVARAPVYQPYEYRAVPRFERRSVRRRSKVARIDQPSPTMPLKAKALGDVPNPVPELLADSTLRRGDIVMFPDGPRVFVGRPGRQHALADFEPLSRVGKAVHPSTRKLVAHLRPGWIGAWSAEKVTTDGRLAAKTLDVDATASVTRTRR